MAAAKSGKPFQKFFMNYVLSNANAIAALSPPASGSAGLMRDAHRGYFTTEDNAKNKCNRVNAEIRECGLFSLW